MTITSTFVDQVAIFTTSAGTGSFVLGNADTAYGGVEQLTDGVTYSYSVQQDNNREYGRGVYNALARTLTRVVLGGSYGRGAPVPFNVGAIVTFSLLAEDIAEIIANAVPPPVDAYALQLCPWFNSSPGASELLAQYTAPTAYMYLPNFAGSVTGGPRVRPVAPFVLSVTRLPAGDDPTVSGNWVSIGSITVATDGTITMVTLGGDVVDIASGDTIAVHGPGVADTAIVAFNLTLKGFIGT